ncbi:MAG: hypothetical protein WKF57_08660 [Nakamurella sp.]
MSFLGEPPDTSARRQMYDEDLADEGYVMNLTRVWAHDPAAHEAFWAAVTQVSSSLTVRERAVLVTATAATLGDSYCALAWGSRLAGTATPEQAASVLGGADEGLSSAERALARWARAVTSDPSGTTAAQVDELRDAGYTDGQIFAITGYVAMRIAFSTINGALGAHPDPALAASAPEAVRTTVTWGRPAG